LEKNCLGKNALTLKKCLDYIILVVLGLEALYCLALTNFPNALLFPGLEKECLGLSMALRKMP